MINTHRNVSSRLNTFGSKSKQIRKLYVFVSSVISPPYYGRASPQGCIRAFLNVSMSSSSFPLSGAKFVWMCFLQLLAKRRRDQPNFWNSSSKDILKVSKEPQFERLDDGFISLIASVRCGANSKRVEQKLG